MSTVHAIGTYNILSEEGRRVAAFLIPQIPIGKEFKEPHLVAKSDYELKSQVESVGAQHSIGSKSLSPNQKQLLRIQLKLEGKPIPKSLLDDKELEKLSPSTIAQEEESLTTTTKPFQNFFIPTKNVEPTSNSGNVENQQSKKESLTNRLIIWIAEKFSQKKK
eukprot:gene2783-3458_t